mgnify:FL=1|tara:strand:+ start:594 stop:797 length:204 start_codon:yes stop_codon:yes gene_type:complete
MKEYILQTFDKKEIKKVFFKKWDTVIKMAENQNSYMRELYETKSISRNELESNIIGFIVGDKQTYCF